MLPETTWAYFAGIVDGEGSICIASGDGSPKRGKRYRQSAIRLSVANTSADLMKWIIDNFSGRAYPKPRKDREHRKIAWDWQVSCRAAVPILHGILPFLVIKRTQAELLLEFQATKKNWGTKVPVDVAAKRNVIQIEVARLNRRGSHALQQAV